MRLPLILVAVAGLVLAAVVFVLQVGGEVRGEQQLGLDDAAQVERERESGTLSLDLDSAGDKVREVLAHEGGIEELRTVLPQAGHPVMMGQVTDDSLVPVAGVEIQCEFQAGSLVLDLGSQRTCELGYFFCDLSPLEELGFQELARGKVVASGAKQGWIFTTTEADLLDMLEDAQQEDYEGERRLALQDLGELRWMEPVDPTMLDENSLDCDIYMDALPGRKVRGQVIDQAGIGVADAVVWLSTEIGQSEFELRTEADGTFEFGLWGEEEQSWGDSLRLHGIHPSLGQSAAVSIPAGETPVELRLQNHGALLGYVTSKHGVETAGMEIWMESVDERHDLPSGFCATRVGYDGSFAFRGLLPGQWILNVGGEEYGPFETGDHRIQIETECNLLRVNIDAPSHVDLSLVALSAWPMGNEGPYPSPSWGSWYSEGDFQRVGPNEWLLQLDEVEDLGISATVDWGESFQTSTRSWRGQGSWGGGQGFSVDLRLEQRGAGSLKVEVDLPGGARASWFDWTASVWDAANGESILQMDPGDVETLPSGSYTVKLVPDADQPFDVQFLRVEVLPGQHQVVRFQPRGTGGRLSLFVDGMTREQLVTGLDAQLFHGDDQEPTATIWNWSGGCVGGTTKYLYHESWNTSQRLLLPGDWRADFVVGDDLVAQLDFEIVDGQDVSQSLTLGN